MGKYTEQIKKAEQEITPLELISDIVKSIELFYCEDDNSKLPRELNKFSGLIHVILKDSKLLKLKLEENTINL